MPFPMSNIVQFRKLSDSKWQRSTSLRSFVGFKDIYPMPSPTFDRLPVELQIEVFLHCLPPLAHFDPDEAPLLLSRVCCAWRALVLSVPKFWSSFEIEVSGREGYDSYVETLMSPWLERSRHCPLNVSIMHFPTTKGDRSARLLKRLIPEAYRWKNVQLILPPANMTSLPSSLPNLQSFTLQLKGSTSLRPSLNISTANIPWFQLSRLDIQLEQDNLLSLTDALSILSRTPRLRICTFSIEFPVNGQVDVRDLNLPLLEELHLIVRGERRIPNTTGWTFTKFLHCISTPILRVLEINWLLDGPTCWPNCHFMSFIRRISPTLRTLSLSYLPISEADLGEILTPLTKTTHVLLHFSLHPRPPNPISDHFLSLLTLRSLNTEDGDVFYALLPSLISLDLHCNGSKFSNSTLLTMIKSRWKKTVGPGDLCSRFRFLFMRPSPPEMMRQVQLLADEGLDIKIESLM